ncbi:MAG: cation:proton antiporter, partial [Thermoanaerobaculia bacterium]|nr:cation:proton antiporter [Thermoanaerobaculia bacterium]
MPHASTFLTDLTVVLVVAAATSVVCRLLRQPLVLGYLLAGLIVGPYIPIPLFADAERVAALAEFGVVLVMFSVGLEFSFRRLRRVLPAAGLPAVVQMSTLAGLGILLARVLGWGDLEGVFLGACLAISSTMVVVRAVEEVEVPRPASELAMGILVTQDLVAVVAIAALTAIVSGGGLEAATVATSAGEITLFLIGLVVVGLLVVPSLVRYLDRLGRGEMLLVAVVGLCFGFALLAERMGYSVALGAFVAGSLVAESGLERRISELVEPLRDLFAAVFFVAVGMAVDPVLVVEFLGTGLLAVGAIVVGQLVSVTLAGTLAGRGLATSVRSGAALGQIGEFSFIIATLGVASGAVRPSLYSIVVVAAVLSTFTTPIMLRWANRIAIGVDRVLPVRIQRMLTLYSAWLESLSTRTREEVRRTRLRRAGAAVALDAAVLVGLTVLAVVAHQALAGSLSRQLHLPDTLSQVIVLGGILLLAIPFAVGVLRSGRALGRELAGLAMPRRAGGGLDLGDAPRRAMTVVLEIAVVLLVALIYVAATQSFLPLGWGVVVLVLTLLGLGTAFWRTSGDLDEHVQAGAMALAETLMARAGPAERAAVVVLLRGLGHLTWYVGGASGRAAGATLSELNLRGRTGVTVLAVRRGDEVVTLPGGDWGIAVGDVLGLTGSHVAVERALALLRGETAEDPSLLS